MADLRQWLLVEKLREAAGHSDKARLDIVRALITRVKAHQLESRTIADNRDVREILENLAQDKARELEIVRQYLAEAELEDQRDPKE